MSKFDSTSLPQSNDPKEIQKMGLDLLDKLKQLESSVTGGPFVPLLPNPIIDGEPSLGTPHELSVVLASGAAVAAGLYTQTLTSFPAGAKRASVWFWALFTNTGTAGFRGMGGVNYGDISANGGQFGGLHGLVILDDNKQFVFATNTPMTLLTIVANYYDM